MDVLDGGEALGAIAVRIPPGRNIRAAESRLLQDLANQASVAFRNASLDAEAEAHLAALNTRAESLAASRRRIVAARDAECRRLEATIFRDVFPFLDRLDASMHRLLTSAAAGLPLDGVEELLDEVTATLETLRELSHGVFPLQLERAGIGPTLSSYLAKTGPSVTLRLDDWAQGRRFGAGAEAAAYFCCVEAVPHCSPDGQVVVEVEELDLVVHIHGIAPDSMDLQRVKDRVEALQDRCDSRLVPPESFYPFEFRSTVIRSFSPRDRAWSPLHGDTIRLGLETLHGQTASTRSLLSSGESRPC